jgi:hypothetical protein
MIFHNGDARTEWNILPIYKIKLINEMIFLSRMTPNLQWSWCTSWDTGFSTFFAPPLAGSIVSRTIKGFCSGKRGKFEMALLAPGVDSWFQGNQSGCRRQMCLYCCISRQPNPPRGDDEDRHATVPSADITWTWKYAVPWPYTRSLVNH